MTLERTISPALQPPPPDISLPLSTWLVQNVGKLQDVVYRMQDYLIAPVPVGVAVSFDSGDFLNTSGNLTIKDTGINHNGLVNTHNLTTNIDHNTITNTHNLTTDITHNSISGLTTGNPHTQYLLKDGTVALTGHWDAGIKNILTTGNGYFGQLYDSSLTAGRIPYIGASSLFSDSSDFLWDNTNKKFQVNGTIFSLGVTGSTPMSGAGMRFMWIPAKGALRAGSVDGGQWNDDNMGVYSLAVGEDSTASGDYSTAIGYNATASGYISTAIGKDSTASGNYSTAIGWDSTASAANSFAIGYGSTASNSLAMSIGHLTIASGSAAIAMGEATISSGDTSMAMGEVTVASGDFSTSAGGWTLASGQSSFAIGHNANNDTTSFIAGTGVANIGLGQIAIGYASAGKTLKAEGTGSVAIGQDVNALTNDNVFALGLNFTNNTASSFAIGFNAIDLLITSNNANFQDCYITTTGTAYVNHDTAGTVTETLIEAQGKLASTTENTTMNFFLADMDNGSSYPSAGTQIKNGFVVENTMRGNQTGGTYEHNGLYFNMGSLAELPTSDYAVNHNIYGANIRRGTICVGNAGGGSWDDINAYGIYLYGWGSAGDISTGLANLNRYAIYSDGGNVELSSGNFHTTGTLGAGAITGTSLTASGMTVAGLVKNSVAGLLSTEALGADHQIPFMSGTTSFQYSANFTFDDSVLSLGGNTGNANYLLSVNKQNLSLASAVKRGIDVYLLVNTGGSNNLHGGRFEVVNTAACTGALIGIAGLVQSYANLTGAYGLDYLVKATAGTTIGTGTVARVEYTTGGTGIIGAAVGLQVNATAVAGTITDGYGIKFNAPTKTSGTFGTNYYLYMTDAVQGSATTPATTWAIYSLGGKSWHAGDFAFGGSTRTPGYGVDVATTLGVTGLTTATGGITTTGTIASAGDNVQHTFGTDGAADSYIQWDGSELDILSAGAINLEPATSLEIGGVAGWTGTFTDADANTVTVTKGIITNVAP